MRGSFLRQAGIPLDSHQKEWTPYRARLKVREQVGLSHPSFIRAFFSF
jgi:hypothetical protein